jgi:type II secretory pathway predicted ATPase ExeA
MYYEYWGLQKPPFDNVPDPSMYVDCDTTMENAIAETLFAIEEGGECIAVIVGDVGLGKTLSLRIIIDSLDPEKYRMALITNPGISFVQLLREIIGQLTGEQCNKKRKGDLLALFNKILFQTIDEGKQVLIFIDEANAMTPANLESLRLLTNLQLNEMNMFAIVLAGQLELARRLEHPKRANLYQRIGTYGKIEKLGSIEKLKTYVDNRLKLAGADKQIFTEDAYEYLWEHSDNGVPRLINKIAKLSLKAGETNQFDLITGDVVKQIGECFQKLTRPSTPKRRPRKKPERKMFSEKKDLPKRTPVEMENEELHRDERRLPPIPSVPDTATAIPLHMVPMPEDVSPSDHDQIGESSHAQIEQGIDAQPVEQEQTSRNRDTKEDIIELLHIGNHSLEITIPYHVIEHALSFSQEKRVKLAGAFAAYILRKNGTILTDRADDPVHVWGKIKNLVLTKFK